jgi:hypothetical protein
MDRQGAAPRHHHPERGRDGQLRWAAGPPYAPVLQPGERRFDRDSNAQRWIKFGFEICLGLANQVFGLGAAGLLRRLTVYPVQAVWPQSLPTLALVRTLIHSDPRREVVSGWRISRWLCFILSAIVFGLWYWFPNNIMVALQRFDWMCWIAPRNFNVNIVTGAYGGMGFNPISTFDPNYSGSKTMEAPFFA